MVLGKQPPPEADHVMVGLPFMPLMTRPDGRWLLWCPVLGRDGRCTDYENRPALCRSFEAGSDPLCAMHHPSPTRPRQTPDGGVRRRSGEL